MSVLVDTNVALYVLGGDAAAADVPAGQSLPVSFVTALERLGYPDLTGPEEEAIRAFLGDAIIVGLNDDIERETVRIRRSARLKLPDALVVATALVERLPPVTADHGFLRLVDVPVVLYEP